MNYNVRIDDNFLRGDHVDGEVLQHSDLNELENVVKTAINANYEDIQKLQDGTITISNSEKLDGATLSKFVDETLQNSDTKVPTSSQVKNYVDGAIGNIDLDGYYTKRETDGLLEDYATLLYVDDELDEKVDKVTGKGLSTNDYTNDEKSKLTGIETGAQVNTIETVKVNGTSQVISSKSVDIPVPTKVSDLTNDSGFITKSVSDLENYYTKSEVDDAIDNVQVDLTDYVKFTDYATAAGGSSSAKAGVIKVGSNLGTRTTDGYLTASTYIYSSYQTAAGNMFISKGTLENVITGKGLTTKSYVDGLVGDIQTLLDDLDTGSGV